MSSNRFFAKNHVRRQLLLAGLASSTMALPFSRSWSAQSTDFPTKPFSIVVPMTAGGSTDIIGRTLAKELTRAFDLPAIVENKPGATGAIGTQSVVNADPDGHTLLMAPSSVLVMNPSVNDVPYDVERDLKPVGMICMVEVILIASVNSGFKSLDELVAYAKKHPGKVTYGSNGIGSAFHLAGALLEKLAGIEMLHVPYKGGSQSEAALLTNEIDIIAANTVSALPAIQAGKTVPLAVISSMGHSAELPDTPLGTDSVPDYVVDTWLALYTPAKTDDNAIAKLNQVLNTYLSEPEEVEALRLRGMVPMPGSPEDLQTFQRKELEKWQDLTRSIRETGGLS